MEGQHLRVLLVEDDEDDFVIMRDLISDIDGMRFELAWVSTYSEAVKRAGDAEFDVCILDYRLGEQDGINLLKELKEKGFSAPIIILTGQGDHDIDVLAMREGAADYLEKATLSSDHLERSIRYAIDRSRNIQALQESEEKLRALSSRILEAQENERKIVAKELHDSVGSSLTAIKYALEQKLVFMKEGIGMEAGISLEQIITLVRDTMEEIHRISSHLRPSVLDDLGLVTAIRSMCREFEEIYKDIEINTRLEIEENAVPGPLKIIIYRIAQESLNNIAKHSEAEAVQLTLERTEAGLALSITDDGRGFDRQAVRNRVSHMGGMGLEGMKERAELYNGRFEIVSDKGKGTTIRAFWPPNL
jgi:signal transduction histidine kinase